MDLNEIINSGMWTMYFEPVSGEINRVDWSDEFRRMIGYRDRSDFPDTLEAWTDKLHPEDKDTVLSEFGATLADKTNKKKFKINNSLFILMRIYLHIFFKFSKSHFFSIISRCF